MHPLWSSTTNLPPARPSTLHYREEANSARRRRVRRCRLAQATPSERSMHACPRSPPTHRCAASSSTCPDHARHLSSLSRRRAESRTRAALRAATKRRMQYGRSGYVRSAFARECRVLGRFGGRVKSLARALRCVRRTLGCPGLLVNSTTLRLFNRGFRGPAQSRSSVHGFWLILAQGPE